jgi:hypothetical protein
MLLGKSSNTLKGVLPYAVRLKPYKPKEIQIYEGLVYKMKNVLVSLDKLDMAYNPTSQVKKE